ncbi:MAG: TetR/AcrR family transcriptional regulator [Pelotomaculum sp.]|nr:TetR/AcrR family transcriptional regulator [Pelotomaculum sp.]
MVLKREAKKDLIADAAMSCFLASGYSGTSVDSIVKASGVSKGGIYWHFKSKEEIFLYLVEKWLDENRKALETCLKLDEPATAKLARFVDFTVERARSPVLSLINEFVMAVRDDGVINRLRELMERRSEESIIAAVISRGIEDGEFKSLDAGVASEIFVTMFHGLVMRWHFKHKDISLLRRVAKTAMSICLEGLLNRQAII